MGTRYNISTEDFQRLLDAGIASSIEGEETIWHEEWNEKYEMYEQIKPIARLASVGIGGWKFTAVEWDLYNNELSGTFTGPNWGKDELDEIFEKFGIKPEYY